MSTDPKGYETPAPGDESSLTQALRRCKPARVRVYAHDTEGQATPREVSCTTGRAARHTTIARTVLSLGVDIERVELCDAKGAIIDTWRPSTLRDQDDGDDGAQLAPAALPEHIVLAQVITRAIQTGIDHGVDRHTRAMKDVLDGFKTIVQTQAARNEQLERMASNTLKLLQQAVRIQAENDAAQPVDDGPPAWVAQLVQGFTGGQLPQGAPSGKNGAHE